MRIEAHILTLDELPNERSELARLIRELPFGERERERLHKIRNETALRQSLGGRIALWRMGKARGFSSAEIVRTETGKPYFADPQLPAFSISHSGSLCVAALCERAGASVGVDVQGAEIRGEPLAIAERFFTPEEQRRCAEDAESFWAIWTQKEAVAKQNGMGLAAILRSSEALVGSHTRTLRIQVGEQLFYLSAAATEEISDIDLTFRCRASVSSKMIQ